MGVTPGLCTKRWSWRGQSGGNGFEAGQIARGAAQAVLCEVMPERPDLVIMGEAT
jgi:hypothetical protein